MAGGLLYELQLAIVDGGALNEAKELEVRNLCLSYRPDAKGWHPVLHGVCLDVRVGQIVGVLGPSGAGKSSLALAVAGALPCHARITAGRIERPNPHSVTALVYQEPATVLSPFRRVGEQVADVAEAHFGFIRRRCRAAALDELRAMQFEDPEAVFQAYPHELSGGQRQRIVLAQAFIRTPTLVVADEPTSALDTVTQAEILRLFKRTVRSRSLATILITHNPLLLRDFADRIVVIHEGRIIEENSATALWAHPAHPYTQSLMAHARLPW